MSGDLVVRPGIVVPESALAWHAVRSSGPGGQNVNKVSSKVVLVFDFEASPLFSEAVKARLRGQAGRFIDAEGKLAIKSDKTRDQQKNLADAREKLAACLLEALHEPKKRRPTRRTRGSNERRLEGKRVQSGKKRERSSRGDD